MSMLEQHDYVGFDGYSMTSGVTTGVTTASSGTPTAPTARAAPRVLSVQTDLRPPTSSAPTPDYFNAPFTPPYETAAVSPTSNAPSLSFSSTSQSTTSNAATPDRRTSAPALPDGYDSTSPLAGLPEHEGVQIPPLVPPALHWPMNSFDDWDQLPDLLKQDRKADYTPRRPMNIYFIYMRVRRPELALHNPNLSTGELSKILGKEWNSMSPDQKAPWNELAERLMRAFKKKFPDYQYERGGGKKAMRKRPRSAPGSFALVSPTRSMVDAAAAAAARRASHVHHPQMRYDIVWEHPHHVVIPPGSTPLPPTPMSAGYMAVTPTTPAFQLPPPLPQKEYYEYSQPQYYPPPQEYHEQQMYYAPVEYHQYAPAHPPPGPEVWDEYIVPQ